MKKTNTFKRFAAITSASILAACMVAPMAMTSNAADTTTITITDATDNSQYSAYQLMTLVQDGTKFAYTVNPTYKNILVEIAGVETEGKSELEINKAIVDYIDALDADSTTAEAYTRNFADAVYAKVKAMSADKTINGKTGLTVDQGYYLIAETKTGDHVEGTSDDSYSLVMLDTAGDDALTVTTKENEPKLEKKVKDINDSETDATLSGWQDSADHDFDDTVPFQLTGTVSAKYANYKEYYYSFHDTLSKGLTLDDSSIKVYIGDEVVTSYFKVINKATDADGNTSFEVMCPDLKKIDGVTADSKIVVEYNATLNDGANIGSLGNPNVAYLEYSTNPYFEGKGTEATEKDENEETGKTPEDKVIVFTYQVSINKVDQNGDPLSGAGFTLYKKDKSGNYVKVGDEITGVTTFEFKGLDDGDYKLVESTVPAGYNSIADKLFTISAEHDEKSDDPKLTVLNGGDLGTGVVDTGIISATIENKSGTELPSTGGIGTTLFYLGGGAMVAVAGVYLISKKRMKNAE